MAHPSTQPLSRRERRAKSRDERLDRPGSRRRSERRRAAQRPASQSPVVLTTVGAILVGLVVIALAGGLKLGRNGSTAVITPETSYEGVTTSGSSLGSSSAPVVMQVYSDFQCPVCKMFITTELQGLLNDYVRPGLLRIESTDIDIVDRGNSTESLNLAIGAACAAQQDLYWPFHDLVFWNQGAENTGYHDSAFIDRMATAAGLDLASFHACIGGAGVRQAVQAATTKAAAAGVDGTPTILVNGQKFMGVPDYGQLTALITQLASAAPQVSPGATSPAASPAGS